MNGNNILFASLMLPIPDKQSWIKSLEQISPAEWHWDEYRGVSMAALMTSSGASNIPAVLSQRPSYANYNWTPLASQEIRDYFETHVFPWAQTRARIMVLKTPAGQAQKIHIDCSPEQIGSRQHKFRIALSGSTSSLYFLTPSERIWVPETQRPFIIDGSWPHGMHNQSSEIKYTVCLGAPWNGSDQYPDFETTLLKTAYESPEIERSMFHPKY